MPGPLRTVGGETREWNGSAWVPYSAPVDTSVPMYHPGLNESPSSAALSELERTAGEATAGLAHSPWDLVKNTVGMVAHPIDALENTAHAIIHPVDTVKALGDDPRAAGSLLGQIVLGHAAIPPLVDAATAENLGGATRAIGSGMETAGKSKLAKLAQYGGVYRAANGSPMGAAMAVAPEVLKYGGRGLQNLGDTIEGLKSAAVETPKPNSVLSGVTLSPDAVARNVEATNMRDVEGFSHGQAGKLSGIPGAGESEEIPYKATQIPKKYGRPFPNVESVDSPEPAEEVRKSVIPAPGGSIDALKTAASPDLMDQYMSSLEGGVGSGKQSFEMGGVNYVPDETGSHVAAPAPYDASKELDPAAIEAGYAQNNPVFRSLQDQGLFGGDRNNILNPDVRAAIGNPGLSGLKAAIAPSNALGKDLLETLDPRITGLPPGEAPALTPYADSPTIQYGKSVFPRKDLAAGEFLQRLKDSLAIK